MATAAMVLRRIALSPPRRSLDRVHVVSDDLDAGDDLGELLTGQLTRFHCGDSPDQWDADRCGGSRRRQP
jgi:hypothetical protein